MGDRVFVTGAGIVSALGVGKEATLRALLSGESGVEAVRYLPTEHKEFPVGEVKLTDAEMSRMLGAEYPADGLRTVLLGALALREAVAGAGLGDKELRAAPFVSGTTVGGMDKTERHFGSVLGSEDRSADPESAELRYNDCGYSTELIADMAGRFAMTTTTSTACSSAANAIILGAEMIRAGLADIVVAGGSEPLTRFHLNGFNSLMILDRERCRPFDADRNGINLGEGAAYVVLEREESALRRGAKVLGELSGYANACDAFHQTATSDDGEGAYRSMTGALAMAGLRPEEIDYINAHGTGTPNNDRTELAAMQRIWGDRLPPFSSTKAFTGHTTSASGAIEAVICLLALEHGFIPPNLGCKTPIEGNGRPVTELRQGVALRHVVDNSFGFGGNDSTLIFSRHTSES